MSTRGFRVDRRVLLVYRERDVGNTATWLIRAEIARQYHTIGTWSPSQIQEMIVYGIRTGYQSMGKRLFNILNIILLYFL